MATEKTLKTRVVLKHDTEANWKTAGNAANPFIPKKGEVIIYDPDGTHTYSRQKVGDGIKNINELPFLGATVGMADSSESLFKIQYMAESAIPTTPEQGVEYAITDLIGYGDLDSELQAKVDAGANAGSNLNTKASVDYVNKTHYGYSGNDLLIIPEGTTTIEAEAYGGTNYKCIVIPDSVTSIGEAAFNSCSNLRRVIIGNNVTNIGEYAFASCPLLTEINIGNHVTTIGSGAFQSCHSLTNITIPDTVTSIGDSAFYDCSSLRSIVIPKNITSINMQLFYHCSSLISISIPNSVTTINPEAFNGCSSLKDIKIPEGITTIEELTFNDCKSLTNIILPNSVTTIFANAFSGCSRLKSVTMGNNLTSIGEFAFSSCSSIESITIPDSVTSIGDSAFISCPLTTVDLTAYTTQSFPSLGNNNFTAIASDCQIKVVKGRKDSLIATSGWSSYANYVVEVPTVETLDTAITDVKNGYLPLTGGTLTGKLTIGSTAVNKDLDVKGDIACKNLSAEYIGASGGSIYAANFYTENPNNGGEAVHIEYDGTITTSGSIVLNNDGGTLSGISDLIGDSSTIAVSQKCLKQALENSKLPISVGTGTNSLVGNDLSTNTAISENVVSFGTGNKGGLKGYYWSNININTKTITLATAHTDGSPVRCGYAVGDKISIVNEKRYDECSTITAINYEVIHVDSFPFTTVSTAAGDWTDYCIYCPEKADIGLVDLGRDCFIAGNGNKGGNWCSIVAGRQNNSIGHYGAVFGRLNKVSYAGFSSGRNNKTTGWYSASTGRNNTVTGLTSFATGDGNTLSGIEGFAAGQTNNISEWRGYIIGFDNGIYSRAGFVIGRNNTINNSNNDGGAFDVAIGMNNTVLNSYVIAIGKDNYLSNYNSKCFGTGLKSSIANQMLFGQYNKPSNDAFVFGYGSGDGSRLNAATISSNGNLKIGGSLTLNMNSGTASTISGISNSTGTSSTLAMSQKGVADNYVAKSELPSNLLKYQVVTSTSQIGTDPNTAYLILE